MEYKKSLKIILLALIVLIVFTLSISAENEERNPRFNINAVTEDGGIGQLGILYPLKNSDDSIFYTDLRARTDFDNDVNEWNIGLGYRQNYKDKHIAGIYLFRDRRKELDHYWDMWTLGGEVLTDNFDLRLNAYLADNERLENPAGDAVVMAGGRLVYKKSFFTGMDGLDFEVSKRWRDLDSILNNVGVHARLYRFFDSDIEDLTGKELRIDKQFGDSGGKYYNLGVKWKDDSIEGSDTEATFSMSIPFGKTAKESSKEKEEKSILEKRMTEAPVRDLNVVIGKADPAKSDRNGKEAEAVDPATGEELGSIYYVSKDGNGNGSKDNPTNIEEIQNIAEENDIMIFLGDNGEIINNIFKLKPGQKLLSPGGYLEVRAGGEESRKAFFRPEGKQAALTGNPSAEIRIMKVASSNLALIQLSNNTTVSGLKLKIDADGSGDLINGKDVKGEININNNIFEQNTEVAPAQKFMPSTYISRYNSRGFALESNLAADESLNLKMKNNQFTTKAGGAVDIRLGSDSYQDRQINLLGAAESEALGGKFTLEFNNNEIKEARDYGLIVSTDNLEGTQISINDNKFEYIASDDYNSEFGGSTAVAVNQTSSSEEKIKSSVKIKSNTINNLKSSGITKAVYVNNELNGEADVKVNISENNIYDIFTEGDLFFAAPKIYSTGDGFIYSSTDAVAVNNVLDGGGKAEVVISENRITNIEGIKITDIFSEEETFLPPEFLLIAEDFSTNGIQISNSGEGGTVENRVENNIINLGIDSTNEGAKRGILINNSQSDRYSSVNFLGEAPINYNLDSAYNFIKGNTITNLQTNFGTVSAVKVLNTVNNLAETEITGNNIYNIQSGISNLDLIKSADPMFQRILFMPFPEVYGSTNAVYVNSELREAGTAQNKISKNNISRIKGIQFSKLFPNELYIAENFSTNAVMLNNSGVDASVFNEINDNNIQLAITADNEGSQRGIFVNNSVYFYSPEYNSMVVRKVAGLKTAETEIIGNKISGLYSIYGRSSGILLNNEVSSSSQIEINKNKISDISSTNYSAVGINLELNNFKAAENLIIEDNTFSNQENGIVIPANIFDNPEITNEFISYLEAENEFEENNMIEKVNILSYD